MPSKLEEIFNHFNRLLFLPFSAWLRYLYAPSLRKYPFIKAMLIPLWTMGIYRKKTVIGSLQRFREILFHKKCYDPIIDRHMPSLIVATRFFQTDEYHLFISAKRRGISTVLVVASWDNLYCYSYLPVRPDHLIVWNEWMKQDAIKRHGYSEENISIIGPPQFDIYFKKDSLPTKEEYFKRHRLDISKRLITFTTADILTDQQEVAKMIYKTVIERHKDRQLLVRIHPQEPFDKYINLPNRYERFFIDIPGKKASGSADRVFSKQDFTDLACCMSYSDVVINVCSTITLDAAVADTPVICYRCLDAYTDRERIKKVIHAHDQDHFRALIEVNGLSIAENNDHLSELVNAYLKNRNLHREKREAITSLMIPHRDGSMSMRLAERLIELMDYSIQHKKNL
jgi:CDP-glycerol glycerophosphotransferase (TagB/SpsB family)